MCHELVFRTPKPWVYTQSSFRAFALMSMVAVLSSACTSWRPIPLESVAVPDRVRITTVSRERVELRDARIVGDTAIAGLWKGSPRSIRLVDIQLLELGQTDLGRTIPLVAGLVVGIPLGLAFACVGGIICGGL